eukprot:GHVN01089526.1.p2 GENE.GHVN01089526.1~~GHVN01089526.1.p2  ORF type:complete len:190 (+),score=13.00 GHVN01089526.1:1234-1803(+)
MSSSQPHSDNPAGGAYRTDDLVREGERDTVSWMSPSNSSIAPSDSISLRAQDQESKPQGTMKVQEPCDGGQFFPRVIGVLLGAVAVGALAIMTFLIVSSISQKRMNGEVDCGLEEFWTLWSACSVTCGSGHQKRRRTALDDSRLLGCELFETKDCFEVPCADLPFMVGELLRREESQIILENNLVGDRF